MNQPVILCVDDEVLSLTIRKMVLEKEGYRVMTASDADQAYMLCAQNRFDLVLTDYYLQQGTGAELARKLKKKNPNLTVAILSGAAEVLPGIEYADAFLSKTLSPPEMLAEVAGLIEQSRRKKAA